MSTLRQAAISVLKELERINASPHFQDCFHAFDEEVTALRAALSEPEQPISNVTEAVTKTVIEIEKLLCEKLGRKWQASGMGIETLINELASRKALAEPEQEPAPGYCKHCKQYTIEEPLPAEPQTTHWKGCEAVHPECRKQEPVVQLEFAGTLPISRGGYAPTPRKPLTDEMVKRMKEVCTSMEMRGAFADGWLSAEAAHGIGEQT